MKLCKDCRHFEYFDGYKGVCSSPKLGMSLIDGKPRYQFATKMRKDYIDTASCGTDGIWWEPKPPEPVKKPWYKIWIEKFLQE